MNETVNYSSTAMVLYHYILLYYSAFGKVNHPTFLPNKR